MNKPTLDFDDDFDFGFTSTTPEEIAAPVVTETVDKILKAIEPLLKNLEKDADKSDNIYWPKRAEKIQQFRKKLYKIAGR